ncbi:MAG TPA: MFS transporter [Terriglobia bacterium]|nr:MFS transporter [Terriglobia bacterium]
MNQTASTRVFYGWWIVLAAFLNLFFAVGLVFYGLPVFYTSLVDSLHFTRSQVAQGLFLGFVIVAPAFGFMGALIDRIGARRVLRVGILLVASSIVLMGSMTRLWEYYVLCIVEVVGYVLAGPISNQVLVSTWFQAKRGRAMGYAYLGLGLGGVAAPVLAAYLIGWVGWRRAFVIIGVIIGVVLFPVAQWLTRSAPGEMGLVADGLESTPAPVGLGPASSIPLGTAVRTANFWLILAGSTLTIGAIGTVIQQFVLFLRDTGYTTVQASHVSSGLLFAGLAGRVAVGYLVDRYNKKNVMALFYLLLALAIPLLFLAQHPAALWLFALIFGFAMGADYLLIPLVTAECFGLASLGKLLSLIIMADSLGQFFGPVLAGKIFEATHSYDLAWSIITTAGILGAAAIYAVRTPRALASG